MRASTSPRLLLVGVMMMVSTLSLLLGNVEANKVVLPPPSFPAPPTVSTARGVRTGVLIHGCHLGARQWRTIMWGDERQQRLGRLPYGARLAWEENACVVVLGTGASEKGGVLEGQYALEYLTGNWERLREFREAFLGVDLEEMRRAVQPLLVAEVCSLNTREELLAAGRIFRKENCDRIILVSSPTHLSRCLRDACSLWLEPPSPADAHATGGNPPVRRVTATTSSAGDEAHDSDGGYAQTQVRVQELAPRTTGEESAERVAAGEIVDAREGDESAPRSRLRQLLDESNPRRRLGKPLSAGNVLANNRDVFSSAVSARQRGGDGDEGGEEEKEEEEDGRRRWRPVILASPSGTSYADYGPDDVVIVEPPHRGDDEGCVDSIAALPDVGQRRAESPHSGSPEEVTPDEGLVQHGEEDPLLLHELVALALRVKKSDIQFRRELEELIGRRLREE